MEKTHEEMEAAIAWEIEYAQEELDKIQKRIDFLKKYTPLFHELKVIPSSFASQCKFTEDSREKTVAIIKSFSTEFKKTYEQDRVTYSAEIDGITVNIDSKPPDACRIVEYEVDVPEVVVPAHKEKKRRIECLKPEMLTEAVS